MPLTSMTSKVTIARMARRETLTPKPRARRVHIWVGVEDGRREGPDFPCATGSEIQTRPRVRRVDPTLAATVPRRAGSLDPCPPEHTPPVVVRQSPQGSYREGRGGAGSRARVRLRTGVHIPDGPGRPNARPFSLHAPTPTAACPPPMIVEHKDKTFNLFNSGHFVKQFTDIISDTLYIRREC